MQKWILPLGAFLLIVPNFLNVDINHQHEPRRAEQFDASLSRLSSIEKLSAYVDSIASERHVISTDPRYLEIVESAIETRFYHGFSHYKLNDNWVAAVSEKIFGRGLSCIVKPEDIMKKDEAACSQSSIVMMELLKRKHIDYRKVGFPHHYALEAKFNNHWYFADANQEPNIPLAGRLRESWKGQGDSLKRYYDRTIYANLDYGFGVSQVAETGAINEVPAKHLSYFHSFTRLCSWFSWCLPLIFIFLYNKKRRTARVITMNQSVMNPQMLHRFYIS